MRTKGWYIIEIQFRLHVNPFSIQVLAIGFQDNRTDSLRHCLEQLLHYQSNNYLNSLFLIQPSVHSTTLAIIHSKNIIGYEGID